MPSQFRYNHLDPILVELKEEYQVSSPLIGLYFGYKGNVPIILISQNTVITIAEGDLRGLVAIWTEGEEFSLKANTIKLHRKVTKKEKLIYTLSYEG